MKSMHDYSEKGLREDFAHSSMTEQARSRLSFRSSISKLAHTIRDAEAVVIGAGAGLSESGGLSYSGERFQKNFADFISEYGLHDMYSATFYPYDTLEEYWAYMSRHIFINRYTHPVGEPCRNLLDMMKDKDYFVITTNVDHQFQKAWIDKSKLFYTQGDYGLWQCSKPCHDGTYDNEETVMRMVKEQEGLRVPSGLIPYCPKCGRPMSMNLRCDHTFVQDDGWRVAAKRYEDFIQRNIKRKILFWELGVGGNTPVIIKYPFWQMTAINPYAIYVCVNLREAGCPSEIENQSICIGACIGQVMESLRSI